MLIRPAEKNDLFSIARIHIASWQDAYAGVVPEEVLASRNIEQSLSAWQSTFERYPDNISVAVNEADGIVGFCCAGPVVDLARSGPFEFEIYGLHVQPDARRLGIGTALLHASFERASGCLGMKSAIIWTLHNLQLSRRFYEREGGQLVKTDRWKLGEWSLSEVAYGWPKLNPR